MRTFPESFSPEIFSMSNNFVEFNSRRMPHHMVFSPPVNVSLISILVCLFPKKTF